MDEIMAIIQSFKTVLDDVMTRLESLEKRQSDIENMIIKEFLDPLKESVDDFNHNEKVAAFKEKCGDKFDPYLAMVKQTNGDDYDIFGAMSDAYDNFEADNPGVEKPSDEEFIDGCVAMLQDKAEELKKALGAETVEIKADENGNVETTVDGKPVEEAVEEKKEEEVPAEETKEEEPAEETKTEEVIEEKPAEEVTETKEEPIEEDSPEEVEADYKRLLEELKK